MADLGAQVFYETGPVIKGGQNVLQSACFLKKVGVS